MPAQALTASNFDETVSANDVVVVDFWAPWCGPCRNFAPVFEQAAEELPDVVFGKVNTDEEQELAGAFRIRSIPTLMVFRERIIVFQQAGALPRTALLDVIEQAKALDMDEVRKKAQGQGKATGANGTSGADA